MVQCDTIEEWDALRPGLDDIPPEAGVTIIEEDVPARRVILSVDQDHTPYFIPPEE